MPTHTQLGLLPDTPPLAKRGRRRKTAPQLALFPGRETLSPLRYRGRPWGPLGSPFTLRPQGQPTQPALPVATERS